MYSPFEEEVHVFTFHPSMHGELAQVAGMALFIFTELDTAHNGRLVQPQSEILSEERVERRGEGRVKGREEGGINMYEHANHMNSIRYTMAWPRRRGVGPTCRIIC